MTPSKTEQAGERPSPFPNCRFRECILPGQCLGEGKCHHPAIPAARMPVKNTDPYCLRGSIAEPGCKANQLLAKIAELEDVIRLHSAALPPSSAGPGEGWQRILYICDKNGHELHETGSEEEAMQWYDMEKLIRAELASGERGKDG